MTQNSRAGIPKRTLPNCHSKEVNSNQRGSHLFSKWPKGQEPWRRGATGFCKLSWQLLVVVKLWLLFLFVSHRRVILVVYAWWILLQSWGTISENTKSKSLGSNRKAARELARAQLQKGYDQPTPGWNGTRVLHRLGACFMVPGIDYPRYVHDRVDLQWYECDKSQSQAVRESVAVRESPPVSIHAESSSDGPPETNSAERMVENIARDSHLDPVVTVGIVSREEQPALMITKDVKDFREPTEWWSRTSRKLLRISTEVRVDNIVRDSAKTSSSHGKQARRRPAPVCLETTSLQHKSVTCPNAQSQCQRHCTG